MATILPRKKARVKKSKIPPRDTLTEQQRKEIEESFDILDTDGSGEECDEGFCWGRWGRIVSWLRKACMEKCRSG
jgi:hypothetical protein